MMYAIYRGQRIVAYFSCLDDALEYLQRINREGTDNLKDTWAIKLVCVSQDGE